MKFYKNILTPLFLFLASCSTNKPCIEWKLEEIKGSCPTFNSGRLLLSPQHEYNPFEIEVTRTRSGLRMHVNLLLMELPPHPNYPDRASLEVVVDDHTWVLYPYRLKGGQRLLIPDEASSYLIEKLLAFEPFTFKISHYEATVIPDQFPCLYQQLIDLPINEEE